MSTLRKRASVVGVIVLIAGTAIFLLNARNERQQKNRCIGNLIQIYSAVTSLALEGRYYLDDTIPASKVASVLADKRIPTCPSGGSYTIPKVGEPPTCSYHGNLLAAEGLLGENRKLSGLRRRPEGARQNNHQN